MRLAAGVQARGCGAVANCRTQDLDGIYHRTDRPAHDDWANFRAWGRHPETDERIAELEANGSLAVGLNYYRANIPPERFLLSGLQPPPIQAPTMGVWSSGDFALTERQMTRSAENLAACGATSASTARSTGCSSRRRMR